MKTITRHYVRMEDMNHHGSLYGGTLTEWMTEAAFFGVAATLGRKDHVVMCALQDFKFLQPAELGTIMEFQYELVQKGKSSLTVAVKALDMFHQDQIYSTCQVVFVNTDEKGKSCPHGL